jgi:hypothetical protein
MTDQDNKLSQEYRNGVHAATGAGLDADPEAQLTTPVSRLLSEVIEQDDIGIALFIRETQMTGVKPDFGILVDGRFRGWLELKAPNKGVDPAKWATPHDLKQWGELRKLDNLLLCDGREIQHYSEGEPEGSPVVLPFEAGEWKSEQLATMLRQFVARKPLTIRSASQLAKSLAPLAKHLRLRIEEGLGSKPPVPVLAKARQIWADLLQDSLEEDRFADALAQVITYSLVIATLDGQGDINQDGQVDLSEAQISLDSTHRVLAATLRPVLEVEGLKEALRSEIGALERLLGAVDTEAVEKRKDPRGDPWLWFYEDFLESYDPEARKKAGVYYTPIPVVDCIVRLIEGVLTDRFGMRLGFGDEQVVTLDPAVGTGTFPLAVIDHAASRAEEERGEAGPSQIAQGLAERLFGFEILPGPFAVAHLRVGERLNELGADLGSGGAGILLADTLDSPSEDPESQQKALFGPAQVLSEERQRAKEIKRDQPVMIILGNPPYARIKKEDGGGWVVHGDAEGEQALFDEIVSTANERTIFAHVASLYNLYAYFWRWSIWKAFEQHGEGPGVVGMITGSSWLGAPGFVGLRELARDLCDEIWIIDLGGDNKGTSPEENVFAIETPVSIVVLIRDGATDPSQAAKIFFQRISGSRKEKLKALEDCGAPTSGVKGWAELGNERWQSFLPVNDDEDWAKMPRLFDLMPWQQPGCKLNRTWPVAPDQATLTKRWQAFLKDRGVEERAKLFPDPSSGRRVTTDVSGLPTLADLPPTAAPEPFVSYGWRALDRQWTFRDPRLAGLERPSLWQSVGPKQIFLTTLVVVPLGPGPALAVSSSVPDMANFRGSYGGKDIIPLFRDSQAEFPNITKGLLDAIGERLGCASPPTPEDLTAYLFALLSTPGYQSRFSEQLDKESPRIPITAEIQLWDETVQVGRYLLWLQTFTTRFRDSSRGRGSRIPDVANLGWTSGVKEIPKDKSEIEFDGEAKELKVGDGIVSGVRPEVWEFEVSGWPVVKRWLEHRTAKGRGKKSSELDSIRPEKWIDAWNDELLDLLRVLTLSIDEQEKQGDLLETILAGPLIPAEELPSPSEDERKVPETIKVNAEPSSMTFDDLEPS